MTEIVHLFNAEKDHLNLAIIESLLLDSRHQHRIVLARPARVQGFYMHKRDGWVDSQTGKGDWQRLYRELFTKYQFSNFHFCSSTMSVIRYLNRFRLQPMIIHSGDRRVKFCVLLFNFSCLSWVCWGSGFRQSDQRNPASFLINMLIRKFISKLNHVVCLMKPDADYISNTYHRTRVHTIPYASVSTSNPYQMTFEEVNAIKTSGRSVLLGNSGHHVKFYLETLELLNPFSHQLNLTCMVNYGLTKNHLFEQLLERGREMFGEQFLADETFYNKEVFLNWIQKFDVFVCGVPTQSGMGTIGTCLRYGKKVYLAGYNYDWIVSRGYKVFHVDTISTESIESFLQPLTEAEKRHNYLRRNEVRDESLIKREQFFDEIISESRQNG